MLTPLTDIIRITMSATWLCLVVLCGVLRVGHGRVNFHHSQPHVDAPVGTISGQEEIHTIHGQPKTVTTFLGIPYAESIAGVNRFKKPVAKAEFTDVFNATTDPPACYQGPGFSNETSAIQVEDCLMLNVYVPQSYRSPHTGRGYPVMVWVHGGGFITGTSSEYKFQTLSLAGNVIVVTINYRLKVFGFLRSRDGQLPGNQGLWDQHLAFRWVNRNVAAFYGDPSQVTIIGHSAGSASVTLQAMYPGNRGLFSRVIAQSGSALAYWAANPNPNADFVYTVTGCSHGATDPVTCLRNMPAAQLHTITLNRTVYTNAPFQPSVDGDFIIEQPYDIVYGNNSVSAAAREFFASLDILTGVTNYDGAANFLVWPSALNQTDINNLTVSKQQFDDIIVPGIIQGLYYNDHSIDKETCQVITCAASFAYTDWSRKDQNLARLEGMTHLSSDAIFFVDAIRLVKGHADLNRGKTYMYVCSAEPTRHLIPMPRSLHGSNHADEIPFLGQPLANPTPFTRDQRTLSHAMMTMWTNFAKSGSPNLPVDVTAYVGTTWPRYDTTSQQYLDIDYNMTSSSVKERFNARSQAFWTHLVPRIIKGMTTHAVTTPMPFNPVVDIVG